MYVAAIWPTVSKRNCRVFLIDEVLENLERWKRFVDPMDSCMHTYSAYNVSLP